MYTQLVFPSASFPGPSELLPVNTGLAYKWGQYGPEHSFNLPIRQVATFVKKKKSRSWIHEVIPHNPRKPGKILIQNTYSGFCVQSMKHTQENNKF